MTNLSADAGVVSDDAKAVAEAAAAEAAFSLDLPLPPAHIGSILLLGFTGGFGIVCCGLCCCSEIAPLDTVTSTRHS